MMKLKNIIVIAAVLLMVMFAIGCTKKIQEKQPDNLQKSDGSEISNDIDNAAEESNDLNPENVDGVDKDLDNFNW